MNVSRRRHPNLRGGFPWHLRKVTQGQGGLSDQPSSSAVRSKRVLASVTPAAHLGRIDEASMRKGPEGFDREGLLRVLREEIELIGGQVAWATAAGIHRPNLNMILNGHRVPNPAVVTALGLERLTNYRRKTSPAQDRLGDGIGKGSGILDREGVLQLLREEIERAGGQVAWAKKPKSIGLFSTEQSTATVHQVPPCLRRLGWRR